MRRNGYDWRVWLMVLGFILSIAVAGIFAVRSIHAATALRRNEPIRPWMTIPYIAHSYHVHPSVLYQALGLSPRPRDRRPLAVIAREQHRPVQNVITDLQKAIAQAPSSSPPSPPGSPRSTP